jgi:ABC-type uncharacterized transport system permease subunit
MSSLTNITVTCFAASYLVAWLLELSRLFFRSGIRGAVMIAFAAAGLVAHTIYLAERAAYGPQPPLSSSFDWCLLAAWLLILAYLYLTYYFPRAAIGLFILPLALSLIFAAANWANRQPIASAPAISVWGAIHGVLLLLGTVAVMVGFVAGVMYLIQSRRLKHKLPPTGRFRFPSLEWLEKVNSRVIFISTLMVAGGFLSGVILKTARDRHLEVMPWSDPIIWSSALMLGWLVIASLFSVFYRPARQGQKVAYLTLVSFVFLVIALGVLLLGESEHGRNRKSEGEKPSQSVVGRSDSARFAIYLQNVEMNARSFTEVTP